MYPDEARAQILRDFTEDVLRDMATIVGRAYPRAMAEARKAFCEPVARDYYPIRRRAMIEDSLPMLKNRHPQLRVTSQMNRRRTSSYHQITHNRSVVTQSKTDGPGELPREAEFRKTLAESPQLVFEEYRELVPGHDPTADAVFGILGHGPAENDAEGVGYIEVLIPDAAGERVLSRIDLFGYWTEGVERVVFPVEPIAPVAPRLRIVPRESEERPGG
jgi:hypothetical protein